jgi:hypothetical protein
MLDFPVSRQKEGVNTQPPGPGMMNQTNSQPNLLMQQAQQNQQQQQQNQQTTTTTVNMNMNQQQQNTPLLPPSTTE